MGNILPVNPPASAPPEYGTGDNPLFTHRLYLDDAMDLKEVEIAGSMLWASSASSKAAVINVRFNDQLRGDIAVQEGFFVAGTKFSRLYISAAAQAGAYIDLVYAVEGRRGIRIENPASQFAGLSLSANEAMSVTNDTVTAVAGVLLAANSSRKVLTIQPIDGDIYISEDPAVTVANGYKIPIGGSFELKNKSVVSAIAGANVDVRLIEET